jgi:hypothetical protein
MIFLSSYSRTLMGIKDTGEWKNHAVQVFKSMLHLTVRNGLKTQSPIPGWGLQKIKESWNVQQPYDPPSPPATRSKSRMAEQSYSKNAPLHTALLPSGLSIQGSYFSPPPLISIRWLMPLVPSNL